MPKANKKTEKKKVCDGVASSEISVRKFYSDSFYSDSEAILTRQPLTKKAKMVEERKWKKKQNSAKMDHVMQPGSTLHVSVRHGV